MSGVGGDALEAESGSMSSAAAAATDNSANHDRRRPAGLAGNCSTSPTGLTPSAKNGGRIGAAAAGSRRRPIPVGSFVDQAFSLNLPGSIRLVSVPAGTLDDDDDDDDDYEDDDDDATAPFLTSYYPLIPLLLSLCLPVAVLYQHYTHSRSCLHYFDPAANSDSDSNSASDSASGRGGDVPAEAEAAAFHAPFSIVQNAVLLNVLRLLLAVALVVYGPALRIYMDRLLRRIGRSPAGRAVKTAARRILAVCGRNDDHHDDSAAAATPSSLFLGGGPNRERTASGSSLPGGSRSSSSSPTGHLFALKALAALTLVLLAVHPDGCLWYLLAGLWEGMGSVGDLLVLIGEGGLPSLVVTGVFLTSLVLARQIRRVLIPPDKSAETADSSSGGASGSGSCSAGKLGKGRSKKGKKGKGRGSGRGRIRHQQSRNAHHHHHQYNDNLHEAASQHGSIDPFKSSTSSHISVSSLEEQTTGEPSSELRSKSAKKKKKKRGGGGGGGGGKKLQAAGPSSPTLAPPTPQTPRHPATTCSRNSAGNHNEATSRHHGGEGGEGGTTPQPSSSTVPSTRSSTKKEYFTPSRENKGPKDRHKKSKTSSVDRNRNCNHPGSPAAGVGNDRPAIADPCSNGKAEQSQTSFSTDREGRRPQEFVDPWQARVQDTSMSERGSSQLGPTDGIDNTQSNLSGTTAVGREFSLSSPGGPTQTMLRPPPGLAPLLDTVCYPGNDESTHQGNTLPPIGYESSSIGGNVLLALEPGRTVLGNPFLQTDHTDGLLSPAPMSLGTDPARTRRLSGDDMIDFRVGISASAAIPSLPPLPQSNLGVGLSGTALTGLTADTTHVGGLSIGLGVGSHLITGMDDDDKIEADLQELGGQMVGSVLD